MWASEGFNPKAGITNIEEILMKIGGLHINGLTIISLYTILYT